QTRVPYSVRVQTLKYIRANGNAWSAVVKNLIGEMLRRIALVPTKLLNTRRNQRDKLVMSKMSTLQAEAVFISIVKLIILAFIWAPALPVYDNFVMPITFDFPDTAGISWNNDGTQLRSAKDAFRKVMADEKDSENESEDDEGDGSPLPFNIDGLDSNFDGITNEDDAVVAEEEEEEEDSFRLGTITNKTSKSKNIENDRTDCEETMAEDSISKSHENKTALQIIEHGHG
ncbi:10574_t:CDS:2, partial [Paraglomus occultum]